MLRKDLPNQTKFLLATTALVLGGIPVSAIAGPKGGQVTGGGASISVIGNTTTVHQTTPRTIIDWRSFDVESYEQVRFDQPGSSSVVLNRINDSKASQIDGSITANGRVMLLNQNGIMFGNQARVDVAGLIATTSQVDDAAFMNGDTVLHLVPGQSPNARIVNNGHITAQAAGLVGLVAPQVENNGIIEAKLGRVMLAGAERVTLDLVGDNLITVDVTDQANGLVKNTGHVIADGGTITLTASRAKNAVDASIINTGVLRANTVQSRGGRILLLAGGKQKDNSVYNDAPVAAVQNAGTIEAKGLNATEKGGTIEVLADSIQLQQESVIDTSGMVGGGIIHIGGEFQGGGESLTATWVKADEGTLTVSNSLYNGDGGRIVFWADRLMYFSGRIESEGGEESGNGGIVEVSGKNRLVYDGVVSTLARHGQTGTLLLDPTDIIISAAPNQNITPVTPFEPNADDAVSILNATTLLTALAGSSVVVQTRATGSQAGNITVSSMLNWAGGNTLTLQAANDIIINQSITGANLTLSAGGDIAINAALTGTGTIWIKPEVASNTIGLAGGIGILNLSTADLNNITNGWANIIIGRIDGTGDMAVEARGWSDNLTLRTGGGIITIGGAQTMAANNLTITTDVDIALNAALTGTGTLTITGQNAATTIGLGSGQAGAIQFADAEIANITNGWASLIFGNAAATGVMNVGALTWNDALTLRTAAGAININGTQTMGANNLTITTNSNLALAGSANLTGTGTLTIAGQSAATTIGLGTGQAGTLSLTDTELGQITNGWGSLIFGLTTATGAMNVGARTWNDNLTLRTAAGVMNINGTQTMGANNLTMTTNANLALAGGANLTGSGTLTISTTSAATTIGVGTGQAGTLSLTDTELNQIANGWAGIIIGNSAGTGAINVGARTWNDNLTLRSAAGQMNINGTQTMGANNLTISSNSNINIGGNLIGTGALTIAATTAATTIAIGAGQTGAIQIDSTELSRISDGWSGITIGQTGGTGIINIGTASWNDNLTIISSTGAINVNGTQNLNTNSFTINTNANPTFGAAISGTGILTIQAVTAATTIGIAGGAGTLNLSNVDLGYILNDWDNVIFGSSSGTGNMAIGSYTWQRNAMFRTGTGIITISGAQSSSGNNITYETSGNMVIAANISGSGILTFRPSSVGTVMNIATGATGLNLTAAELNFIQDGWSKIVFGRDTATGAVNVGARTWTDNVQFISGTGAMTVAAQSMGANNLTFTTNSNLTITGNLAGTGELVIEGASVATGIGVGTGQAGALNLTTAELAFLAAGWGNIQFGNINSTAAINIGAKTWSDPVTFITRGNVVLNGMQASTRNSGNSLVFASLAGSFVNNAGAVPIDPGIGSARYLIYSVAAGSDTYGAMTVPGSTLSQTYFSYGPASVIEAGNRIIYSAGASKTIFIQIDNKLKVYGDNVPTLTWTYIGGLEGADTLGGAITAYTLSAAGALTTDNVGVTRAITGSFTMGLGYTVSVIDGLMSVTKAPIVVQPVATSRAYGDANPIFALNYIGLKNGETSAVIDTAAVGASAATLTSNVGTYTITTSGGVDNNYAFNYATGTLTVSKADLTLTADNKSREYGLANPVLTISYSGFKNGETSAVIDTPAVISTAALVTDNVGSYAITLAGGLDNNYNLVLNNGTLSITKATITVTIDDKTREYGLANPAFTFNYSGFRNGENSAVIDTLATISSAAVTGSNVGIYAITGAGASDNNYDFSYVDGSLSVTKAMLTATADDKTREYGLANPVFTFTYSGFRNGDTSAVIDTLASGSTAAVTGSNVGIYAITGVGASDNNYDFTYADGNLSIIRANLVVTANDKSRYVDASDPVFTHSVGGLRNGDAAGIVGPVTYTTTALPASPVGDYAITPNGAASTLNYNITYADGVLRIRQFIAPSYPDSILSSGIFYTQSHPNNGYNTPVFDGSRHNKDFSIENGFISLYYYPDPLTWDDEGAVILIDTDLRQSVYQIAN